ncbi:MAG: membrane protein insertase YidC [Candidatus Binataceae bacterium]
MENSRLLLALVISLGIVFLYSQLLKWRYPHGIPGTPSANASRAAAEATPALPGAESSAAAGLLAAAGNSTTSAAAISAAPGRYIEIDTSYYTAELNTLGGRLSSFTLKDYRETSASNSPPYQMIESADRLPLGLIAGQGDTIISDSQVNYSTTALAKIVATPGGDVTVAMTGATADGIKFEKSFVFKDGSYVFLLDGKTASTGAAKISGIGLTMSRPLNALAGFRDIPALEADVGGKVFNEDQRALLKGIQPLSGTITYAGFGDRYFLAAMLPVRPTDGTIVMDYEDSEADAQLRFSNASEVVSQVYMGPKKLDLLEAANPSLSKAINFGWAGVIALPFLKLLQFFYRVAPNYGLDIILLTIVVRLLILPMSIKGQRSMMKMQRLQPQVERIREKHKDDQERLNKEMVELYKRNHVNPLGGCLPMLVQMPVFIGLYEALLNATELRHAPFIGWIRDLSAPDCVVIPGMPAIPFTHCHGIPVLVILMTATSFLQQWMAPRQPDPSQQKMMMYMPVMFSLIFIDLPAGLTLYYFASNLLGIIQQFVLNREFKQYTPAT